MKKTGLCVALCVIAFAVQAQENWDAYLARFDDFPGSVTVNMARKETAPVSTLPFVVVTGLTFKGNCPDDGFPEDKEMNKLQDAGDVILKTTLSATAGELVGTFLYQCERLNYIYVKDTARVREKLLGLYKTKYRDYKYYINIKPDKGWEYYLDFLYPNEEVIEYMSNQKIIDQLESAGDKLDKPRNIDYTFYFADEKGREGFIKATADQRFKVTGNAYVKESADMPYQLRISRVELVEVGEITKTTLALKKTAQEFKGDYDGWVTVVLKK